MIIKILGTGCSNCKKLYENTKEAVKELGIDATIEKELHYSDCYPQYAASSQSFRVDRFLPYGRDDRIWRHEGFIHQPKG